MEMLFIYGFPSLLILLSFLFAGLAVIKHIQENKSEFRTNTFPCGISFIKGNALDY